MAKLMHRIQNARYVVFYTIGTLQEDLALEALRLERMNDPRLKHGRIDKVLQMLPNKIIPGKVYDRYASL